MVQIYVDDADLKELRRIWTEEQHRITSIINYLREKFGIEQRPGWERLILYGRPRDNQIHEEIIGFLIAITPGVVILDADKDNLLYPLSGLLYRIGSPHKQLFGLKPFSPPRFYASLNFWPSDERSKGRFEMCPVYVKWQIGARQGESYGKIGVDPARWEIMRQWFDKWLPESE